MSEVTHIKVEKPLSRAEKIRVTAGAALLVGLGAASVGGIIHEAKGDDALKDTHPERVSVTAGADGNTETDLAQFIQKKYNTPDSTHTLTDRLDAQDPGHDANLDMAEELSITVDVPNNHK